MFKKYGTPEKIEKLDKQETRLIESLREKFSKRVEEFTDEERAELHNSLDKTDN